MKVLHSLLLAGLLCLVPSLADAQVTVTDWRGETVDATAGSVDSDGVRIVYHTAGEGPLVIFVHGVASPWHDYRPAFFAALRLRSPSAVTPIPSAVEPFMGQRRGGGGELAAAGEKTAGRRDDPDRSRRDFAIACRLLETGAGDHAVAATIAAARGSDPQCAGAYIPRTIRAARLHLQHKEG